MKHTKPIVTNEKGVVLALSIFMLALLSMIGMAAMALAFVVCKAVEAIVKHREGKDGNSG